MYAQLLLLMQGLKECFETKNVAKLQGVLSAMTKEDASYHMQRCIQAGLWVPDAKAAGTGVNCNRICACVGIGWNNLI